MTPFGGHPQQNWYPFVRNAHPDLDMGKPWAELEKSSPRLRNLKKIPSKKREIDSQALGEVRTKSAATCPNPKLHSGSNALKISTIRARLGLQIDENQRKSALSPPRMRSFCCKIVLEPTFFLIFFAYSRS